MPTDRCAVLVPIKSFSAAKRRLTGHVADDERRRLVAWLAAGVIAAARPMPVFVACDDDAVAEWAEHHGAAILWGPGLGLNGAIDHGVATIAGKGFETVTVVHGDLPFPARLPRMVGHDRIVIVPDRHRAGTNVLSRPTSVALAAEYGPGSFRRHVAAAITSGLAVRVELDSPLGIDVDTVADWSLPPVRRLLERAGFHLSERSP